MSTTKMTEAKDRVQKAVDWLISKGAVSTQENLAVLMGYSRSMVNLILNGKANVTRKFAYSLSDVTNGRINAAWIMYGDGEMLAKNTGGDITLDFVRIKKCELEKSVARNAESFTRSTGLAVDSFTCSWENYGINPGYHVNADINLDDKPVCKVTDDFGISQIAPKEDSGEDPNGPLEAVDMEEAVLGAIIVEPEAMDVVNYLTPEIFAERRNRIIYETMLTLDDKKIDIDILNIASELKENGNLDAAGGVQYITELSRKVLNSSHIEMHARIIFDCAVRRDASIADLKKHSPEVAPYAIQWNEDAKEIRSTVHRGAFVDAFTAYIYNHMPYIVMYNKEDGSIVFLGRNYKVLETVPKANYTKDYTQLNPAIKDAYDKCFKDPVGVGKVTIDKDSVEELEKLITSRGCDMINRNATLDGIQGDAWYLYEDRIEPYSGKWSDLFSYLAVLFKVCSKINSGNTPNFMLHWVWMCEKVFG